MKEDKIVARLGTWLFMLTDWKDTPETEYSVKLIDVMINEVLQLLRDITGKDFTIDEKGIHYPIGIHFPP